MSVNRRRFLQDSALAAAAFAATPFLCSLAWAQQRREPGSSEFEIGPHTRTSHGFAFHTEVDRQSFQSLIGSSFKISPRTGSGSPVWVRLVSVDDPPSLAPVNPASMAVPPKPALFPVPTTTGYMVHFSGPGTSLGQDTYIFENERMGRFELFIVPGSSGSYTAVFNLLDHQPHGRFIITTQENGAPASSTGATAPPQRQPEVERSRPSSASGPAQELVEPAFRDSFKPKLPE